MARRESPSSRSTPCSAPARPSPQSGPHSVMSGILSPASPRVTAARCASSTLTFRSMPPSPTEASPLRAVTFWAKRRLGRWICLMGSLSPGPKRLRMSWSWMVPTSNSCLGLLP